MIKKFMQKQFRKKFEKHMLNERQIKEDYDEQGQKIIILYQDTIRETIAKNPIKYGLDYNVNEILFLTQYYQLRMNQLSEDLYIKAKKNYKRLGINTDLIEVDLEFLEDKALGKEVLKRINKISKEIKKENGNQ